MPSIFNSSKFGELCGSGATQIQYELACSNLSEKRGQGEGQKNACVACFLKFVSLV